MSESITSDTLVYDIESETFGLPDGNKDKLKFFGCYSYKTKKFYMITNKNDIQKVINAHKYLVGFNNKQYDDLILKREGIVFDYKIIIDLMEIFRKRAGTMKIKKGMLGDLLMSYSLDFITKTLDLVSEGAKGKIDFNIFKKNEWTIQELGLIKEYLERDIMLTKKLYEWCEEYFESFKTVVTEEDIRKKHYLTDAIPVFTYKIMCRKLGLNPDFENVDNVHGEYEGGYVAYPAGEKFSDNLALFDYASLYPNIFIQCNLFSHNCKCCTQEEKWHGKGFFKVEGYYCSKKQGVVEEMYKEFYLTRKKLKKEKNPLEYVFKIVLNGGYGLTGNPKFKNMYNRNTASDCTAIGRQIILYTRKRFREEGFLNVMTDSVGKDSLIRTNIGNFTIEELFNKGKKIVKQYKYHDDKERVKCNSKITTLSLNDNYDVFYDEIKYIIRHKTTKKIYKIYLNCYENLIVTEDHSLIWFDDNGILIKKKPTEMKNIIGLKNIPYKKLHYYRNMTCGEYNPFLTKELLQFLGFWIGDGGINKSSINISTGLDTQEFITKIIKPLNLNVKIEKNNYDIHVSNKTLHDWMIQNGFIGISRTKKIPDFIFNLSEKQIGFFLSGFCSSDGTCDKQGGIYCGGTNEKLVLQFRELFYRIGIHTTMKRDFKPNTYNGIISKNPTYNFWLRICNRDKFKELVGFIFDRKNKNISINNRKDKVFAPRRELVIRNEDIKYIDVPIRRIQKIEEIEYNDYVYDIQTKNTHMFFANDILVHNTDSVCIQYPKGKDLNDAVELSKMIVLELQQYMPFPW